MPASFARRRPCRRRFRSRIVTNGPSCRLPAAFRSTAAMGSARQFSPARDIGGRIGWIDRAGRPGRRRRKRKNACDPAAENPGTTMRRLCTLLLRAACLALALTMPAAAQDYPTKPVRILVPFPPGGINDLVARLLATQLTERLGKQFIVENKTGAGGAVAGELVANAPKDGHTLLIVSLAIAINPWLQKLSYDTIKAFAPVAIVATSPNVVVVNADLPARSLQEFVALAKQKP